MNNSRQWEMMDDAMVEILRQKTVAERLAIVDGMWRSAQKMVSAILKQEHPEWTDEEIRRKVAERLSHGAV